MTPEELLQAAQMRAAALRGQDPQTMSQDADALSGVGGALAGLGGRSVAAMAGSMVQRGDALRQLAMDDRRQVNAERHQQTQEDLQRQQLQQGRWSLSNPGYGQTYKIDGKTGAIIPIGDTRERPAPGSGGAGGDNKEWKALMDSVSTTRGRGNKTITDLQNRLYASDRIRALAALGPNGEVPDLTPQQLTELAAASAALISQGHPAEATIHAQMPKGMGLGTSEFKEWLTNTPHGAGQQGFVKLMLQQADREDKLIHGQMTKAQASQLANFIHLRQKDPNRFNGILEGSGLDPSLIDERGLLIQQPGEATGGGPVKISTPAEFAALPSGTEFIDPRGVHRKKP